MAGLAPDYVIVGMDNERGWFWEHRAADDSVVAQSEPGMYLGKQPTLEAAQRACGTLLPTDDARRYELLEHQP